MNINKEYAAILAFQIFNIRGQTNSIYLYVPRSITSQDISKKTFQNVVFRDYILTLALYTVRTRVYDTCGIKCIKLIIV